MTARIGDIFFRRNSQERVIKARVMRCTGENSVVYIFIEETKTGKTIKETAEEFGVFWSKYRAPVVILIEKEMPWLHSIASRSQGENK